MSAPTTKTSFLTEDKEKYKAYRPKVIKMWADFMQVEDSTSLLDHFKGYSYRELAIPFILRDRSEKRLSYGRLAIRYGMTIDQIRSILSQRMIV